jgi:Protein of unknown function (DUF4231)
MANNRTLNHFEIALEKSTLNELEKIILKERYVRLVRGYQRRARFFTVCYHIMRLFITVGSLIVPALLSIQYTNTATTQVISDPGTFEYRVYWATWVISLLVTTSNGLISVFKIDKKYYIAHTTLEHLSSEGWQYLELSGRYSGFYTPSVIPTHSNQFIFFCSTVEKIKMKQVEEEYYKLGDSDMTQTSVAAKTVTAGTGPMMNGSSGETINRSLIPPTPLNTLIEQAAALPPELLKQIYDTVSSGQKSTDKTDGAANEAKPNSEKETKETNENENKESTAVPVHEDLPPLPSSKRTIVMQDTLPNMPA